VIAARVERAQNLGDNTRQIPDLAPLNPGCSLGTGRLATLLAGLVLRSGRIWAAYTIRAMINSTMMPARTSIQLRLYSHQDMTFLPR
jgi:hypothetical protein